MKADPKEIPQLGDTSDVWKNWYEVLKSNFGKKVASQLFVKNWKFRGGKTERTTDFIKYMRDNGIAISTNAWDDIKVGSSDIGDSLGDFFSVGKYAGIAIGVIVIGGLGLLVYNVVKDPNRAVGSVAKLKGI